MKRLIIAIASIAMMLGSTTAFAQGKYGADSAECIKYLSYYKEYYKQKSYKEATPNWRKAFELCPPTANQTMLVDGAALVLKLMSENSKSPVYKNQLIDTLMMLHDIRIENYPKYAVTARNNKGLDMANYIKDDNQRLYNGLNEIIESNTVDTKPSLYIFNLSAAIELYKIGLIDEEEVINIYERNSELLALAPAEKESEKEMNDKVKTDLENLFVSSKVADCDKLQELFGPRFAADPQNAELAAKIVKIMSSADECLDNDLFINAATAVYNANPNPGAAHTLFALYSSTGKVDKAISYLHEAINHPEVTPSEKAEYQYELAVYSSKAGRQIAALDAARSAAEGTEDNILKGKCYMLMGTIWAGVRCEGNEISSRAQYWVATDYLERARKADPNLSEEAGTMIMKFRQYYPATADAFMFDLRDGQSYEVNCNGFRATTTVRTQK